MDGAHIKFRRNYKKASKVEFGSSHGCTAKRKRK
jgi:hypothetical protein